MIKDELAPVVEGIVEKLRVTGGWKDLEYKDLYKAFKKLREYAEKTVEHYEKSKYHDDAQDHHRKALQYLVKFRVSLLHYFTVTGLSGLSADEIERIRDLMLPAGISERLLDVGNGMSTDSKLE